MDLAELQGVKDTERGKDSLQHLRDSFYADVADHIAALKDERDARAAEADDPFGDPEVQRLTGEIDATEQVVKSIYERRVGKLVKLASFAAADMPADEEGLTSEERELFSDLVSRIKENRAHVLDVLAGEAETASEEPTSESGGIEGPPLDSVPEESTEPTTRATASEANAVNAADRMGDGSETETVSSAAGAVADEPDSVPEPDGESSGTGASESLAPGSEPSSGERGSTETGGDGASSERAVDRTTLRITRDVGEIVGVDDREYDLATDDVVSLPEANAGALVEREAAERLD
ncbi:MAG: hypothetical protein QXG03_04495 [Halalkalicoccus sp.]